MNMFGYRLHEEELEIFYILKVFWMSDSAEGKQGAVGISLSRGVRDGIP